MKSLFGSGWQGLCFVLAIPLFYSTVEAQVVPGTGVKLSQVGDDFEDEKWKWVQNGSKASREQDEQVRVVEERHYRLVTADDVTPSDLAVYRL